MSSGSVDKDTLFRTLDEAEKLHAALQEQGQRLGGMAQQVRDNARITRNLISQTDLPQSERERLTTVWRQQNDAGRAMTHQLTETMGIYGISVRGTALGTSTAVNNVVFVDMLATLPVANGVISELVAVKHRESLFDEVRDGFARCGLDKGQGEHRSPLNLVEDGRLALEQPSGLNTSPTGALIPLRQALERTIVDVFNRCTSQEPASSWRDKVLSIARRCGKLNVPSSFFERLAADVTRILDRLSGAKDKEMQRFLVILLYNEALSFILALLEGIDETRLRP